MSPADRARAAHAAAEAATHPADRAAFKASAAAWEALSRPGRSWSYEPLRRDLTTLTRELVLARGPFQPPVGQSKTPIDPSRVTPTGGRYHVTGVQPVPAAIEF